MDKAVPCEWSCTGLSSDSASITGLQRSSAVGVRVSAVDAADLKKHQTAQTLLPESHKDLTHKEGNSYQLVLS